MADSLIGWMRAVGVRRSVRAGVTLAHRGAQVDAVLLVEQGSVFLERNDDDGNLLPIAVCGRGALVGLSAAILDGAHDADATLRCDSELVFVAAVMLRALTASPDFGPRIAQALAAEALVLAQRCAMLQSQTVRDRVLVALEELSRHATSYPVKVAMPMRDLAAMVAADLTHVCRVMRCLRAEGLVDYAKGRLAICRPLPRLAAARSTPASRTTPIVDATAP